jgi:hypothetical protein
MPMISGGGFGGGSGYALSSGGTFTSGAGIGSGGSTMSLANPGGGSQASFDAGSGSAPMQTNRVGSAMGNVQSGMSLFTQAKGIWDKKGATTDAGAGYAETQSPDVNGTLNADGSFSSAGSTNGGMLGGGGVGANAMGAASGAMGLYSAYQGNGGVGGALSGAMSGMELGMAVGGPIGAAIGAAGGTILGAIGFGGAEKARVYWLKQGRPRMQQDLDSYQQGSMDYLTAFQDIESVKADANRTTNSMGPIAKSYYQNDIKPEIAKSEAKLTSEQRAGRSAAGVSAAQFHVGGPISGFGSMGGPDEGWIRAQRGEFMVRQQAAMPHYQALQAINGGASHADMAHYYGGGGTKAPANTSGSPSVGELHIHAVDSRSFEELLMRDPLLVTRALNAGSQNYSGTSDV